MPYFGLSSFLPKKNDKYFLNVLFQCPISGFLLFYRPISLGEQKRLRCFNALFRAFFFSTGNNNEQQVSRKRVSMPYFGLSSFLHKGTTKVNMK